MQPSPNIHLELQRCAELLEQLHSVTSPNEFDDRWQRFLGHLERVWNKCQNHFGKSPKWHGWKGRYEKQRRIDPLLSYLTNARGAHEHTVSDITDKKPSSIGLGAGPSGTVHIKRLTIGPNGQIQGDWDGDLKVTFNPERVDPAPIINRGKTYAVPTTHLGTALCDTTAVTLGRFGLAFYKQLVSDADQFFAL